MAPTIKSSRVTRGRDALLNEMLQPFPLQLGFNVAVPIIEAALAFEVNRLHFAVDKPKRNACWAAIRRAQDFHVSLRPASLLSSCPAVVVSTHYDGYETPSGPLILVDVKARRVSSA